MKRLSSILTLLLAVQLLLVAVVFWPRSDEAELSANKPLLELASDSVQRIIVRDSQQSIILQRAATGWIMPEYHGLPVDQAKLRRVLEELPGLPRGWPLANSDSAKNRFQVADDNFQRAVEYAAADNSLGQIFLGTAPGFRKVHTRIAGENDVLAVAFNAFELPVQSAEWLDKNLLRVNEVTAIKGLDYQLRREGDNWVGSDNSAPVQAELDKLVNGLTGLRVDAAADIATAAILDEMAAPPTLIAETDKGSLEYRLYQMEDERYIQRSDLPVFFSLGGFDFDRLNEVSAASLYTEPEDIIDSEIAAGAAESSEAGNN